MAVPRKVDSVRPVREQEYEFDSAPVVNTERTTKTRLEQQIASADREIELLNGRKVELQTKIDAIDALNAA